MTKWQILKKYKCPKCGGMFYITYGSGKFAHRFSFVPVNCTMEDSIQNYFDKSKHKSHLIDCPDLSEKWAEITKSIRLSILNDEKKATKQLLT